MPHRKKINRILRSVKNTLMRLDHLFDGTQEITWSQLDSMTGSFNIADGVVSTRIHPRGCEDLFFDTHFQPDTKSGPHWHAFTELLHIIEGNLLYDGVKYGPGEIVEFRPGDVHPLECPADSPGCRMLVQFIR